MKKTVSVIIVTALLLLSACELNHKKTTNPDEYGSNNYISHIAYFPESIKDYSVNSYSFNSYDGQYTCTEIYLDITADEEQFDQIINTANHSENVTSKKRAFYDKDYTEIVFRDDYTESFEYSEGITGDEKTRYAGSADIEKIIYNSKNRNIIFEYFDAQAIGKYPIDEIEYFNRFDISEDEYVHLFDE